MSEDKRRSTTNARSSKAGSAKGARRRSRTGNGPRRPDSKMRATRYNSGLSITVQIPALRSPARRPTAARQAAVKPAGLRSLLRRRLLIVPAACAAIVLALVVLPAVPDKPSAPEAAAAVKTRADFDVMVPAAEQASATKYDAKRDLATYTTTFSGVRLTVSQQPLPPNFDKDKAAIQKTADSINAKQVIDTKRGPLYVATNDTGDQLAILKATDVLLMIHTDKSFDEPSWKSFIDQLKAQ